MKIVFALISISLILVALGCGEEDVVVDSTTQEEEIPPLEDETRELAEEEVARPQIDIPQPIEEVVDKLEQGMEEKDVDLYLEAFWEDNYSYRSDLTTDAPGDDVMFDSIEMEQDSAQGLFAKFKSFDVEFETKEFTEVSAVEVEVRSHYRLLVAIKDGAALPGGYQKMFAEGENIFTLKKRGNRWRISRWEQEEMSQDEIQAVCAVQDICPPEDVLFHTWGALKLRG